MINIETFKDFDLNLSEHLIEETEAYKYAMNIIIIQMVYQEWAL